MGGQRTATAAAAVKGLRLFFVGSSLNQRGLQHGSPLVTAEKGSCLGVQELNCPRHLNSRRLACQLGPAQVSLYRTVSQSAVQLAKRSTQDTSGKKKKRTANTAAQIASHKVSIQMRPIVFECGVCTAISVTKILKDPYDHGVTIVRCMDCRSANLISDQLGLCKEPGSMQRFLRGRGVDAWSGPEGRYELTPESLAQTQPQEASTPGL